MSETKMQRAGLAAFLCCLLLIGGRFGMVCRYRDGLIQPGRPKEEIRAPERKEEPPEG